MSSPESPNDHENPIEPEEHSLLKDPRFLAVASAVVLSAAGVGAGWLAHELKKKRLQQADEILDDPLASAAAEAIDDASAYRDKPFRIGVGGALDAGSIDSEDEREVLRDLYEVLLAKEADGMSVKTTTEDTVARRFVGNAKGNISLIASHLATLRRWSGAVEQDHEQLAAGLSAGDLTHVLRVKRLATDLENFGMGLRPPIKLELRRRLREQYRVFQPNSAEQANIIAIAKERWPSATVQEAYGIHANFDPTEWLVCKSLDGTILAYTHFFPIDAIDPVVKFDEYTTLSNLTLEKAHAMKRSKVKGTTLLAVDIQKTRGSKSDGPTAALNFALEDIAHAQGAINVIGAPFSATVARRQEEDIRNGDDPRSYQTIWNAGDEWNTIVSAFAHIHDDIGFNDRFVDVAVPAEEIEQLAALQETPPTETVVAGEPQLYLTQYPVPLVLDDGAYHARIPAAFKLLYSRGANAGYLESVPIGERWTVLLYGGKSPEPSRQ